MLIYKYRGGNFERDLKSIEENYFYASPFEKLNDPCETLIDNNLFKKQIKLVEKLFGNRNLNELNLAKNTIERIFEKRKKIVGIYSLSKTFNDELLWSHYSDNHKGFCIEYDLKSLKESYEEYEDIYMFSVKYRKRPPKLNLLNINHKIRVNAIIKLTKFKSKRWNYEKEFRIVLGKFGEKKYNANCVTSIYLGINMPENQKEVMLEKLKNRNIKFYQMSQKRNLYEFEALRIK